MSEEKNPAYRMYGLYKHMFDQHGLVLVEDELNQIIRVVCSLKEIECRQAAELARLKSSEKKAFWFGFERAVTNPSRNDIQAQWNVTHWKPITPPQAEVET